jgi:hypothetical protein
MIQRARHHHRRVKPLDGDLRSRTLGSLYPAHDENGNPIEDGASAPPSDELAHIKQWLSAELDEMVTSGISRVLDLSGGDRVMQEYGRDLALMDFCREYGVSATVAVYLGPDMEDFRHATELLTTGEFKLDRTVLVLNEGVIRMGQTTQGAFEPIISQPEFSRMVKSGTRVLLVPRLTCMATLRERKLGFYEILDRSPGSKGEHVSPTLHHMTKTWLTAIEEELGRTRVAEWMP